MRETLNWHPEPIEKPQIDTSLPSLSHIERAAETLRYWMLRTEYAISPSGVLREWLQFTLWTAIVIGAPCVLVVPVVTYLLASFATWTAFLAAAAINLAKTAAALIAFVVLLMLLVSIVRSACKRRR